MKDAILDRLRFSLGKQQETASVYDWRMALSLALRDEMIGPWHDSLAQARSQNQKRVYYLSMEFLMGRLIEDVASNLGLVSRAKDALEALGQDYDEIVHDEPDAALGNGLE